MSVRPNLIASCKRLFYTTSKTNFIRCCPRANFECDLNFHERNFHSSSANFVFSDFKLFHVKLYRSLQRTFATTHIKYHASNSSNQLNFTSIKNLSPSSSFQDRRDFFCQILECSEEHLLKLSRENINLLKGPRPIVVASVLKFLQKQGIIINGQFLQQNIWLLHFYPVEDKFHILKTLMQDVDADHLPLMMMHDKILLNAQRVWCQDSLILGEEYKSRVSYISNLLKSSVNEICKIAVNRHFPLIVYPLTKLTNIFELLLNNNVSPDSIKRDMWIIRHNISNMRKRIEILNEMNVPIKTWLLRSTEKIFYASVHRSKSNMDVLSGYKDTIDYLSKRLNCSRSTIEYLGVKNPNVLKINPTKLEERLDFILENGYTQEDTLKHIRVLVFPVLTCIKRIKVLREIIPPNMEVGMWALILENKSFDEYVDRLKARN